LVSQYITKEVSFKFRGIDFRFALSRSLFSSADIDSGTRLLLKTLSRILDEDRAAGKPPPRYVLDSGCGVGVIGICAAAAVMGMERTGLLVRAQDRDELARLVTLYNAEKNGVPLSVLEAHTEPLLAGPETVRWDLILSNIPAKAGRPVLEDFVRRSAALLNPGGKVIMVAVHTLAGFFREQIAAHGTELIQEEKNAAYSVFVFGGKAIPPAPGANAIYGADAVYGEDAAFGTPVRTGPALFEHYPFYNRTAAACRIEDIPLRLETVHGASGFDAPGGAVLAAAKLIRRLGPEKLFPLPANGSPALIHEPGQGFFSRWLFEYLRRAGHTVPDTVLSGRNILALEAARRNTGSAENRAISPLVPAADLRLGAEALLEAAAGQRYRFIAAFPELPPHNPLPAAPDQIAALWESLPPLMAGGGVFIAGFGSAEAERFDRKKSAGFTRWGDLKRNGFRALAYQGQPT
jgi:precorrin-6B methylase 2